MAPQVHGHGHASPRTAGSPRFGPSPCTATRIGSARSRCRSAWRPPSRPWPAGRPMRSARPWPSTRHASAGTTAASLARSGGLPDDHLGQGTRGPVGAEDLCAGLLQWPGRAPRSRRRVRRPAGGLMVSAGKGGPAATALRFGGINAPVRRDRSGRSARTSCSRRWARTWSSCRSSSRDGDAGAGARLRGRVRGRGRRRDLDRTVRC